MAVVKEHSNEQNGETFDMKFGKKKYCQYILNRKYHIENTSIGKTNQ